MMLQFPVSTTGESIRLGAASFLDPFDPSWP